METRVMAVLLAGILLVGMLPTVTSVGIMGPEGIGWRQTVPETKAVLVGYDGESLIDDYAYLAAVPYSVHYYKRDDVLYACPLLFWNKPNQEEWWNDSKGVRYFMDDWLTYCGGKLSDLILINAPEAAALIPSEHYTFINASSPAAYAKALSTLWGNSKAAVVAIIDDYPSVSLKTKGTLAGSIPLYPVKHLMFKGEKPVGIQPNFHNFTISGGYKWIEAYMDWNVSGVAPDPDLQLYDWQLGQVAVSEL